MLHHIKSKFAAGSLARSLFISGAGGLFLKVSSLVLSFVTAIVLARSLGVADYGEYSFIIAFVTFLGIGAQLGLPQFVVREIAASVAFSDWGNVAGLLRKTHQVIFLAVIGIAVFVLIVMKVFDVSSLNTGLFLVYGIPLLLFSSLSGLRAGALAGFQRVALGQFPELLVKPGLLLGLVGLMLLIDNSWSNLTLDKVLAFTVVATIFAFLTGSWLLSKALPFEIRQVAPKQDTRRWILAAAPFSMMAVTQVLNSEVSLLLLGFLKGNVEVGLYRVASQGAMVVGFMFSITNAIAAPYLAKFHATSDLLKLQKLATIVARTTVLAAFPMVIVIVGWRVELIQWIFGDSYKMAVEPLVILAIGQLLYAVVGWASLILNMTGHERVSARVLGLSAIGNVVFGLLIIPPFGITGAAVSSVVVLFIAKLVLWNMLKRLVRVDSSAIGGIKSIRGK